MLPASHDSDAAQQTWRTDGRIWRCVRERRGRRGEKAEGRASNECEATRTEQGFLSSRRSRRASLRSGRRQRRRSG